MTFLITNTVVSDSPCSGLSYA